MASFVDVCGVSKSAVSVVSASTGRQTVGQVWLEYPSTSAGIWWFICKMFIGCKFSSG